MQNTSFRTRLQPSFRYVSEGYVNRKNLNIAIVVW